MTKSDIGNANIASVASTIIFRVISGPLIDKFGPRRVFALILTLGAIPCFFAGFVNSATGLIVTRAFIGVIGSSFVPCQMWTTLMFAPTIVGAANAMAGGWGNLGGGFTFILMPQIFNMFVACGLTSSMAWRVSFIIPASVCLIVAALQLTCSDDSPASMELGNADDTVTSANEFTAVKVVDSEENPTPAPASAVEPVDEKVGNTWGEWAKMLFTNHNILILVIQYGACFGVELAVNNIIALYFYDDFKHADCIPTKDNNECRVLDQTTAGLIASLFGLMNLFARATGGFFSDFFLVRFGFSGRLLAHFLCMTGEAIFMLIFSYQTDLPVAIVCLCLFSMCVQMSEGTTYSVVPFVNKKITGTVAGCVGAGGNLGAVLFGLVFKNGTDYRSSLRIVAACVGVSAFLTFGLIVQGQNMINVCKGQVPQPPQKKVMEVKQVPDLETPAAPVTAAETEKTAVAV